MTLARRHFDVGQRVIAIMQERLWPDHWPSTHVELIDALRAAGFFVTPRYPVGDGRFLDIVARDAAGVVGIEVDCRRPRRRSIAKLLAFDGFKIIGIRGIHGHRVPGIFCVALRVRVPTAHERGNRTRSLHPWSDDWKGAA